MPDIEHQSKLTPAPESRRPGLWRYVGGGFVFVYICGLPGLQVLTSPTSQLYFHFSVATYAWFFIVTALMALPVAGPMYLIWKPPGQFSPLQRLLGALVLMLPIPFYLQLLAVKLEWFYPSAGLSERYAPVVWLLLHLPMSVRGRVFSAARRSASVVAKIRSPLPVVMALFFFANAPAVPSLREPAPGQLVETHTGSPVYLILFDGLDRKRVFEPDNVERFPNLFAVRNGSAWFEESCSHGDGTVQIVPCFLYQQRAEVTRDEEGNYLLDGNRSSELESVFSRAGLRHHC